MERKKILGVVIIIGLFLLIMLGFGLLLLQAGKGRLANDPASLFPKASPRIANPEDFAKPGASLVPAASPKASLDSDIVVIYGQNGSPSPLPSPLGTPVAPSGDTGIQVSVQPSPIAQKPGWASSQPVLKSVATPAARIADAAKAKPEAPKASAKPKLVTMSEYWIQAASFKSRGKADELKASLAESSLSSVIATKDVDGITYYRVRIGPYSSQAEANGWLGRIRKLPNCADAYVSKTSVQRSK